MKFLKSIWKAIDGNKTRLGAFVSGVGRVASYLGYSQFGDPIAAIGDALTAVGLTHAVMKSPMTFNAVSAVTAFLEPKPDVNRPPELRQITASADIYKPGIVLRGFDGKKQTVKRLLRGGGKEADGSTIYVYEVEVTE